LQIFMEAKKAKSEAGRPRIELTIENMRPLAALHCTQSELAAYFGVSRSYVEKRLAEDEEFRMAWEQGQATGKLSLRRKQAQLAEEGNVGMCIWLGKQVLGQRDKFDTEVSGKDGTAIEVNVTEHNDELTRRIDSLVTRLGASIVSAEPDRGSEPTP
jgi:hypothetical protein